MKCYCPAAQRRPEAYLRRTVPPTTEDFACLGPLNEGRRRTSGEPTVECSPSPILRRSLNEGRRRTSGEPISSAQMPSNRKSAQRRPEAYLRRTSQPALIISQASIAQRRPEAYLRRTNSSRDSPQQRKRNAQRRPEAYLRRTMFCRFVRIHAKIRSTKAGGVPPANRLVISYPRATIWSLNEGRRRTSGEPRSTLLTRLFTPPLNEGRRRTSGEPWIGDRWHETVLYAQRRPEAYLRRTGSTQAQPEDARPRPLNEGRRRTSGEP